MTRPLRIVFIAGEYPPLEGGLGDYTRELSRALVELGHAVAVVTRAEGQDLTPRPPLLRGEGEGRSGSPPLPGEGVGERSVRVLRLVPGWGWGAWPALRSALAGADVVHIQYQTAAYGMHPFINSLPWLLRVRRGASRPQVVTTYHDTRIPYLFPKAGRVRDWVTSLPARGSDGTVATNAEDGARLARVARRLALIPIGSNIAPTATPDDRPAFRRHWGFGPDEPLLVYFGFVNRAKGADTLVEALARLRAAGLPARLLMLGGQVGASDPTNARFLDEVKALAERRGVADAIVWTGFLPEAEVSQALVSADIAALPYRDGVSLQRGTLMAALAHGLPIVTTRAPGAALSNALPRLEEGVNAALVPPDDPAALAETIRGVWDDPALRARLGNGARRLAQAFTWDAIARRHVEFYRDLIGREDTKGTAGV